MTKNVKPIRSGINHVDRNVFGNNLPPLISLLKMEHVNTEWLQLFLDLSVKCDKKIKSGVVSEAISVCDEMDDKRSSQWKQMLQKYNSGESSKTQDVLGMFG